MTTTRMTISTSPKASLLMQWESGDFREHTELLTSRVTDPLPSFLDAESWAMQAAITYFHGRLPIGLVSTLKWDGQELTYKVLDHK